VHSRALARSVAEKLPGGHRVELAMRYGSPSIDDAVDRLVAAGCERLVLVPLYPQYASSSTGSSVEAVYRSAGRRWNTPFVTVVPPFYDDPRFVAALAAVGRPVLEELQPDMVLMSYHGLPERHMVKSDPTGGHCLRSASCCDVVDDRNRSCYRAQCYATSRALAEALDLAASDYTVSFQSRLGRTPWIRPFTDEVLVELAGKGVQRLAVFCPAFVADCLETLEEIGIRADEDFKRAGGKALRLVPGLNAHPTWVDAVVGMVRDVEPDILGQRCQNRSSPS
jgi:protoporphyrin/coproporphyrin ferrochelatase